MDDRKWTFKRFLKNAFLIGAFFTVVFVIYGAIIYWQTQTIEDPNKCFTTKMFKVKLCPGTAGYVKYKDVPKHFFHSLILSEDASFYLHKGFDWFEIKESFRRNIVEWKFARGGSTLTQQLAKNLYLTPEKSLSRKFKEFFISKQIEKKLSKTQILEKYINVVEFGDKIYGINKAAQHYFYKMPSGLNILESIYLVSLLPSPKKLGQSFEKKELSKNNLWRMDVILKRLYRTGKIEDDLYVYIQMLLETYPWPFPEFTRDFLDMEELSIEDEMFMEFGREELEDSEEMDQFRKSETFDPDGDTETLQEVDTSLENSESQIETSEEPSSEISNGDDSQDTSEIIETEQPVEKIESETTHSEESSGQEVNEEVD